MPQYERATSLQTRINELTEEFHADLHRAEVKVMAEWAFNDDDGDKPAVVKDGYPLLASVKVVSYHDRIWGKPDAIVTIDRVAWNRLTEHERDARLDEALEHLVTVPADDSDDSESDAWKVDKAGRPVLKLRPADHRVDVFLSIARRHGEHSAPVAALKLLYDDHGQILFPFAEEFAAAGSGL